jgi:antitoxin component HigA of HigAB toxin-antitoxin module
MDKILSWAISWLYLKRTAIRLKLEAQCSESAPDYEPPTPEKIDFVLAQYGATREDLAVRMGGSKSVNEMLNTQGT